jgi:5-methyltetrahydrofolate--homocysteine methyltransferase
LLLGETILYAKAALLPSKSKDERNIDIPIMVSGTITDASGRTLSPNSRSFFLVSVRTFHC